MTPTSGYAEARSWKRRRGVASAKRKMQPRRAGGVPGVVVGGVPGVVVGGVPGVVVDLALPEIVVVPAILACPRQGRRRRGRSLVASRPLM